MTTEPDFPVAGQGTGQPGGQLTGQGTGQPAGQLTGQLGGQPARVGRPGRRRDRHGRGLRGMLAPPTVPIAHSRSDAFDAMVLHAIDHLQPRLGEQLAEVEFAVEDVPEVGPAGLPELGDDVLDDNAVPLSRLYRTGVAGLSAPVVVLYRRPLESRAVRGEDLADLVHDVVVEQVARLLGRSADEIDPGLE